MTSKPQNSNDLPAPMTNQSADLVFLLSNGLTSKVYPLKRRSDLCNMCTTWRKENHKKSWLVFNNCCVAEFDFEAAPAYFIFTRGLLKYLLNTFKEGDANLCATIAINLADLVIFDGKLYWRHTNDPFFP